MSKLRAVEPGETQARRLTVSQAAATGTYEEQLIAARELVAQKMEDPKCHPRDVAPLSRRYVELSKELDAIAIAKTESGGAGAATPDDEWEAV